MKRSDKHGELASDNGPEFVGMRLRRIRQGKGMTLDALATATGLNKGFLSRLERGAKQPSVGTVLRLSAALEVPVGLLFGEHTTEDPVRLSRAFGRNRSDQGGGYRFELLTPVGGLMEGFLFEPGPQFGGAGQQHDGEEMFFVLAGTVEMRTPDRSHVLETGDCAYFPGHLIHSMRSIGPETATAIIVVSRSERPKAPDRRRPPISRSQDVS